MKVIVHTPTEMAQVVMMIQSLQKTAGAFQVEITDTIDGLSNTLLTPGCDETVAVLVVNSKPMMSALKGIRHVLEPSRVVFVLNTSDHELVDEAHSFGPRVVTDLAVARQEVPRILQRILFSLSNETRTNEQRGN